MQTQDNDTNWREINFDFASKLTLNLPTQKRT